MTTKVTKTKFNPIKWLKSFNSEESKQKKIRNYETDKLITKQKEMVYANYGHLLHLK